MNIEASIVADSIYDGSRLTTMQLVYPRFIHSELMTHRAFSRNASSSRAIPVEKLVKMALDDPAFFVHVGTNKPGMQAGAEVDAETRAKFEHEWRDCAEMVSLYVNRWSKVYGIHKQVANRAMEPWHHIAVVVTATDWTNWFELRDHPAAQPEIQALAQAMRTAMDGSPCTEPHPWWSRIGDTFETMSLQPSIHNLTCGAHFYITNGEVVWAT